MNLPQRAAAVNARETHPDSLMRAKIRKSKQLGLNIKRKEQEPPVPTVGLPYATDKAEVRPGETIKGSDSAYAAGTQNLFLSMDKDTKRSCRIRFPQHLCEAGIRKYKEMRTTTGRLSVHGVPRKVS